MHAAPISTNTKKFVILGKSFYIQTKEIENPKLNDIKGLKDSILISDLNWNIMLKIFFWFVFNLKP